jgi:acetyl-CoA C-acetyltransferase
MPAGDAVICEPVRTPVGRYRGRLAEVTATELAATLIRALLERTGVEGEDVDEVLLGQCYPTGEAPAIGRVAALDAGLPVTVAGLQIDRRCGSGLQAVLQAALQVKAGDSDLIIAGGVESMSQADYYSTTVRSGRSGPEVAFVDRLTRARVTAGGRNHPVPHGMLETAENLRREFDISRVAQDELACRSHERACQAQRRGAFADELVDIDLSCHRGDGRGHVMEDEHPRESTTLEALAELPPILRRVDADATVTAGNACGQSDGAAVCIVTTNRRAAELGLRPLARVVSWAVAGVAPRVMGIGPVPASARALDRAGLRLADLDLIELNEAFAAQVLACMAAWSLARSDFERLNVNGSGISLGHPVGATGARILATMLRELDRRQGRYSLETMCIGGGQGLAAVFERVAS